MPGGRDPELNERALLPSSRRPSPLPPPQLRIPPPDPRAGLGGERHGPGGRGVALGDHDVDAERVEGAQHERQFEAGLARFQRPDPLPADADLARDVGLPQFEVAASRQGDEAEIIVRDNQQERSPQA